MRSRLTTLLTVIGAATVLVLAANTVSTAATGKGFILGRINAASTTTVLQRTTAGPVLSLQAKSGAPIVTNSKGLVKNFNADTVDGKHAGAFAPSSIAGIVTNHTASIKNLWDFITPLNSRVNSLSGGLDSAVNIAATHTSQISDLQTAGALTPVAAGAIANTGEILQSKGVASSLWDSGLQRYEIALQDRNYYYMYYATSITPLCSGSTTFRTGSYNGHLVVNFADSTTGAAKQCAFTLSVIQLTAH